MASIKITLAETPRKDGTHAVRFRIIIARVVRYVNAGIFIKEKAWNTKAEFGKENWIKKSEETLALVYNKQIATDFNWLKVEASKNRTWSADQLKLAYEQHNNPEAKKDKQVSNFFTFAAHYFSTSTLSANTKILYSSILSKLDKFYPGLPFNALNTALVQRYKHHLKEVRNNAPDTIKTNFTVLHDIAEAAVKAGHLAKNPFDEINYAAPPKNKKRVRPTAEELDLSGMVFSKPLTNSEQHAWNVFRMQYYLHGARVGDVLELRWENIEANRVEYFMRKNGKFKSIKLSSEIITILDLYERQGHYIFPYLKDELWQAREHLTKEAWEVELAMKKISIEARINARLKEVARKAGIKIKLSSHMSRHMLADALLAKTKDLSTVKKYLGHSSAVTSENYIRDLTDTDLDEIDELVYKS